MRYNTQSRKSGARSPAVFLDRDGTLIRYKSYLHRVRDVRFYKGAIEAVKAFQDVGYKLILVTNQAGVGRGYFTQRDVERVHRHINKKLEERGVALHGIFICPHHPEEGCVCRKPNVDLFVRAQNGLSIDMERSYLIGDRLSDVIPAKRLGSRAIMVLTGLGLQERSAARRAGIRTAPNLFEASRQILKKQNEKVVCLS